jgi:hypothetical protein
MPKEAKNIANLKMEINREDLKQIVESGQLSDFVESASAIAAEQIRVKIFEELGKQALVASKQDKSMTASVSVAVGFLKMDDDYGTYCVGPGAFCRRPILSSKESLSSLVSSGVMKGMTEYQKTKMG